MAATGEAIMNSGQNIDMTITCNGLCLSTPELTVASLANNYPPCDPADVAQANAVANNGKKPSKNSKITAIAAEEGMGEALNAKRDIIYDTVVVCSPEEFDAKWDELMTDYLNAGGQAIIDERLAAWEALYGDKTMLD